MDVGSHYCHFALIGTCQSAQYHHRCRLAGAIWAQQSKHSSFRYIQRQVGDSRLPRFYVCFGKVLKLNDVHLVRLSSKSSENISCSRFDTDSSMSPSSAKVRVSDLRFLQTRPA